MGKPKVKSGSGKENLNIYVSEVILIFFANLSEMFPSASFYNLYNTPPSFGTLNDSIFLYFSAAALLDLAINILIANNTNIINAIYMFLEKPLEVFSCKSTLV